MTLGTHTITLVYSGDTNMTAATNPNPVTFPQIVEPPSTSISIAAPTPTNGNTFPPNNVIYSVYTPVTLEAVVTAPQWEYPLH